MRIYIKGDYARKVQFGYRELAWKMWFKEMVKKLVSHMLEMMRCFKMTSIYLYG